MTATEKRKYASAQILNLLAPYGYFLWHSTVWRCNIHEKYLINIACDISRFGFLNEIEIQFGSFFAPIQRSSSSSQRLFLGNQFDLAFYIRNVGLGFPLLDMHLSFKEQVNSILPFFQEIILPLLPKNDDLGDYLGKSEQLLQLNTDAFFGIPRGIEIEETALAYLSLDRPTEASRAVRHYAEQCRYAASYICENAELFKFDIDEQVRYWEKKRQEALTLENTIIADERKAFESIIAQREMKSIELCKNFFHIY